MQELITKKQAADLCGVSTHMVSAWINRYGFPASVTIVKGDMGAWTKVYDKDEVLAFKAEYDVTKSAMMKERAAKARAMVGKQNDEVDTEADFNSVCAYARYKANSINRLMAGFLKRNFIDFKELEA